MEAVLEESVIVAREVELAVSIEGQAGFVELQPVLFDMPHGQNRAHLMDIVYGNLVWRDGG
jgi:hypothetical protein